MSWHRPSDGGGGGLDGGYGWDCAGAGGGGEWGAGGGFGAEAWAVGGGGGGGGGAVRWAATRVPMTTIRCVFWCLGWQANSVIVGSGVGLAIHAASGVTMKDLVTA